MCRRRGNRLETHPARREKGIGYGIERIDPSHYSAVLNLKRAKKYVAEIYDGDDLIGNISFSVKGKTGSTNISFDEFFTED